LLKLFLYQSSSPHAPEITLGSILILLKICGVASQGAPPVSTTLAAIFATGSTSVADTGGKLPQANN
jgi:hypothetical protein